MKTELKKLAEDLATKLENEAEGKSLFDLHNAALKACYELSRAIGTGHSPEALPGIVDLYSNIIDTLPAASLYCTFWKEYFDGSEEWPTWNGCTRAELVMEGVSLPHINHGQLEDMASEVADCILQAVDNGTRERHYDRDCAHEWISLYK